MVDLLSDDFLAKLIKQNPYESAAGLAMNLTLFRKIQNAVTSALIEDRKIRDEFDEKLKLSAAKIEEAASTCKHWVQTHHPDPVQSNQSYHTCDICGKVLDG